MRAAGTSAVFDRLTSFLSALGLEPGTGWTNETGRGAPFLAPLGNFEVVQGKLPDTPEVLIEVTSLDAVHSVAKAWFSSAGESDGEQNPSPVLSLITDTHWDSRIFTAQPAPGLVLGFWEPNNPFHGMLDTCRPDAIEGDLSAEHKRFGIVVARWNAVITDRLLQGALDGLLRSGAKRHDIRIVRVPGAWEVPAAARLLAESGQVDAVITLGVLLRGETAHYEAIYNEVSRGIGQSQQETGVPHSFGVLTCETLEQALDRAGLKQGNKGYEAAIAAIEMVSIRSKIADVKISKVAAGR